MGVPQLKKWMAPHSERGVMQRSDTVVDGPALAYHVFSLCSRGSRKISPFQQPSYSLLGSTAIAWLDRLQECGLSVSAIYFDGFLPTSKRPERLQRAISGTQVLLRYHSAHQAGVPGGNPPHTADAHVDLFPTTRAPGSGGKLPLAPFLVPATIDALRASPTFGPLVKLVPGEADGFCAQHVRLHGGTVLTSDSDLLVHDLGESGSAVFLAEIEADIEAGKLTAPQYRQQDLCRKLRLSRDGGFQALAFAINRDPHLTLEQAIQKAKNEPASDEQDEYAQFIGQYLSPEVSSAPEAASEVTALDPRVSEIVLRSLHSPGDDTELEMYLPLLMDSPTRTSAWEASTPSGSGRRLPLLSEIRRLQSVSSGLKVGVPSPAHAVELGASLSQVLTSIEASISNPDLVWVTLAIYQDIVMTLERGRDKPVSLEVLGLEARGRLDPCSWESLHFLAQTQATYYSLRMFRQILDFSAQHTGPLLPTMSKLASALSLLPSFSQWPVAGNFAETLRLARDAGALACLQAICKDDKIVRLIKSIEKPQDAGKSKKRKAVASTSIPLPSPSSDEATTLSTISALRISLTTESTPLPVRFRALFSLKHLARSFPASSAPSLASIAAIAAAFSSPSALLKHELAYCLGQTGNDAAIPHLTAVLEDGAQDAMCRHEAAEALGALGKEESLGVLRRFRDKVGEEVVVKETCEIAVERIEWENGEGRKGERLRESDFASVDPAPPMPQGQEEQTVEELGKTLMDTSAPLFKRYRAMFALRDLASPPDLPTAVPAVHALAAGFADSSALFRHEIAFVFGQLSHPASIPALTAALSNTEEASMVRHEAAEALGSLGDEEGVEATLLKFLHDKEAVVRESVIVALDMAEYEKSNETEYALIPEVKA
ncbi:Deoxyhypusine hydroxylase [Staphylotrichum tortipilum]|uniref:Deoxyhypusine hydroxylase n=1 Tax=Staphylotrichum tortipilum TaxID=2831512 RepID=A0AAN6MRT7_9PEZI|nr:Deoxyhypusine hydroxylase [Staphylotrichum longicolle]